MSDDVVANIIQYRAVAETRVARKDDVECIWRYDTKHLLCLVQTKTQIESLWTFHKNIDVTGGEWV